MLDRGLGCDSDAAESFKWHAAAAEQGHALSQYCAACFLEEGRGAAQNKEESRRFMQMSAASGCGLAQAHLLGEKSDPCSEDDKDGLLQIAQRIAEQLKDFGDDEAAEFLDKFLTDDLDTACDRIDVEDV